MNSFRRFRRLSRRDRYLLGRAAVLMIVVRLGLWTLSFATLRRLLTRLATRSRPNAHAPDADRTVWAVETIGRHAPIIGTCLIQALAAHVLLGRDGFQSNLGIGVTRRDDGAFTAHAWLEREGAIIIGGTWAKHFIPLPLLKGLQS